MAGNGLIQSILHGLDVLEYLAHCEDGAPLARIAAALGKKPPTVHNILRTWMSRGYVFKSGSPVRYQCGPACSRLAELHSHSSLMEVVGREALGLAQRCPGAVVNWSEFTDDQIRMRLRVDPAQPRVLQRPVSRDLAPYSSASGVAFQAFAHEEQIAALRRRFPFWDFGAGLWRSWDAFAAILEQTRTRGYSRLELPEDSLVKMGAPVLDTGHSLAGILGLAADRNIGKARAGQYADCLAACTERIREEG